MKEIPSSSKQLNNSFKNELKCDVPSLPSNEEMGQYFDNMFRKLRDKKFALARYIKQLQLSTNFTLNDVQIFLCMNGAHIRLATHPIVKKWSEDFLETFEKENTILVKKGFAPNNIFSLLSNIITVNRDYFSLDTSMSFYKNFELSEDRLTLTTLKKLILKNNLSFFIESSYDNLGNLLHESNAKDYQNSKINYKKSEEITL